MKTEVLLAGCVILLAIAVDGQRGCPRSSYGCRLYCPNGRVRASNGCLLCQCRRPTRPSCPRSSYGCRLYCPYGRARDRNGCLLCRCRRSAPNCPNGFEPATPWKTCDLTGLGGQCVGETDICWNGDGDLGTTGLCCTPLSNQEGDEQGAVDE